MNSKNLFIAASPLQLLNAIEAKETFKTKNNTLLLMYNSMENKKDVEQKKELLINKEWDTIIEYDQGVIKKNMRFIKQINLIKSLKKINYDYIFSGEDGTFNKIIFANLNCNNIYLMDDGTATIFTYERIKKGISKVSFSKKIRLLRYLLSGLKYRIKKDINFFTIFNLKELPYIKIVKHDFQYLKSKKLKHLKKSNNVYIIGQDLAETGFMKEDVYIKYLTKIVKYYKDSTIIYIPHRIEKITEAYDTLINNKFQIHYFDGPIESSLIHKQIYPKTVISFFSTALFNLDKIFPNSNIISVQIKPEDLIQNKREIVQNCYDFFSNTSIKIYSIEDFNTSF